MRSGFMGTWEVDWSLRSCDGVYRGGWLCMGIDGSEE